jgi:hypothetical protein
MTTLDQLLFFAAFVVVDVAVIGGLVACLLDAAEVNRIQQAENDALHARNCELHADLLLLSVAVDEDELVPLTVAD